MARTHGRGGAGIRKTNKKGATKGSGGQRRKGLAGKGPTPKAEDRIYHAKHKAKLERERRNSGRHQKETAEMVVGRNPVIECLHAKVPATTLYIVAGTRNDKRLSEAVAMCNTRNIPIIEVQRHEMDRMTGNGMHQGIGLQIRRISTPTSMSSSPVRPRTHAQACSSSWITSPTRATSARSSDPWRPSVAMASSFLSAAPPP